MAEQQNREGQQLGNYRLERLLGRGGFADVYLGEHQRLKRQAAIKVLHAYLSEKEIEDFQREAQIIAALDHPNIVRIFDFDVQEGVPFLVMDYLPNGTLRQCYAKGKRLPLATVVSCVKQVADALQYAHDRRLIHRDVKPENMLLGRRQEVILSDFGIAAIAHSTSSMTAQAFGGTIPYMAPEQIQAQARAASDQYALGIVAYEWLMGERPFDGSYTEIFAKHLMTPPPPLRQKLPTLPADVEYVILMALAKEPQKRFLRVQAFATALATASQAAPRISTGLTLEKPSSSPHYIYNEDSSSNDQRVHVWNTGEENGIVTYNGHSHGVWAVTWSPDGTRIASSGGDSTVQVWSAMNGGNILTYNGHSNSVLAVSWSPDGTRIASCGGDNTVQVWNASDGGNVFIYNGHASPVLAVAWSPDGTRIASSSNDKTVQIWSADHSGNVFTYTGHTGSVLAIGWSPNGTRIASGSYDGTVQVWNVGDGGNVFTYRGHSDDVQAVAWSPDGKRIASGSDDNTVQVWDASDGGNVATYSRHTGNMLAAGWSPDGKHIASSSTDHLVHVWDASDGGNVFTYRRHGGSVYALEWSPDGKRIASGSLDRTVHIWDAVNGGNVLIYRGHSSGVGALEWSSDGKRIASGSLDMTVQVWEAQ